MNRYRWYLLKLPFDPSQLATRLASAVQTHNAEFWFVTKTSANGRATFEFMWRSQVMLTRFSEDGGAFKESAVTVNILNIDIIVEIDHAYMRISDPSRNLRIFLNALESIIGFGFYLKAILFGDLRPELIFRHAEEARLVGLRIINVVAGPDLVARMEFASKQGLKVEGIEILKGVTYKIDWMAYELAYKGLRGYVALSSGGVARVGGSLAPRILNYLEAVVFMSRWTDA